ncbi:MAG: hypothetical protein ACREHV_02270 [Rhizomicrobium sp.]
MSHINRRNMLASTAIATLFVTSASCSTYLTKKAAQPGARKIHKGVVRSGLPIPIALNNLNPSHRYAAPNVSYGHAFADGDIPAGGSVTMLDSKGDPVVVQMDAVALWPSGCPRFVVLSHACAETFGPSSSKTYTIGSSANAPDNSPAPGWGSSPEATMAANSNFTVEYSGFDAKTKTYTVSLNNILSRYRNFPWGTHYPEGGWERTKVGPACIEWHAWQYLINDSTFRPQGYVRCDMWIKAWSPTGPFEIDVRTSEPNMWNAIAPRSEMYNKSPGRWATLCTIRNGATVVQYAGGPDDYRATTIPNADFNISNYTIDAAGASLFPQQGVVFASTESLPNGISPNTIYWLAYWGGVQPNPFICTQRTFVAAIENNFSLPAWQPDTAYSSQFGGSFVVNDNIVYVCVQSGTSGSSGGPTGAGNKIVDGTCEWENMIVPFTTQGSGTISIYPVNACFPSSAWMTGDANGNPLWNGQGSRPPIFPGHDFAYLTANTKYLPSYNIGAGCQFTNQNVNLYAPNQNYGGIIWRQDDVGDSAYDQRIGYVNEWGVVSLFNPSDPFYLYASFQSALCYNQAFYSYMADERGGLPFCGNDGPHKNGKAYAHLPSTIPAWAANNTPGKAPAFGVGNWLPWSTAFQDECGYAGASGGQTYMDTTHSPASWQIPYLKTGRPCFLEQGVYMANMTCFMGYITEATLGAETYYCVINAAAHSCQERGWAWALRNLSQALYVTPSSHPFQPVLRDYYNENAAFQASYYTSYVPPEAATLGLLNVADHGAGGHMAPWEHSFLFISVAMEVWRGGLTGATAGKHWKTLLDYMNAFWTIFGSNLPGSLYYAGLYDMVYSPNQQGLSTAYQTPLEVLAATYACNSVNQGLEPPYPSGGIYDTYCPNYLLDDNFGENPNCYSSIMRAALTMVAAAEPTNATVVSLTNDLNSYIASATGLSETQGGIQWYGSVNGTIENFQTFAIF